MKIRMNPIAELDGDEMTRILWKQIKEELLLPFVELNTEYYDLSLPHRDETDDRVTLEAAEAIRRLHVGVKCATITPNAQRVEEYKLHALWKSPNATIRAALDGTVFRTPILTARIKPYVRGWVKPITIARHAYGDVYKAVEMKVPGPGKAELVFRGEDGEQRQEIFTFKGPGVLQGMHNRDDSIESFARACFAYALGRGRTCGSPPRTPSPRSTTGISGRSSGASMKRNTAPLLRKRASPISTPSSTTPLPGSCAARAASSGPRRTTTAT